ncbi:MAG: PIN domain-containing protein [Acidimicrobiales bacterium]
MAADVLLADTSLWHRRRRPEVVERWSVEVGRDRVATAGPIRLEILYSARSADDYDGLRDELDGLIQLTCSADAVRRAEEVQRLLARHRPLHHRSARIPDLLIAATAELAGATVWHYDENYDRIASLTHQRTEWIVPRGTID